MKYNSFGCVFILFCKFSEERCKCKKLFAIFSKIVDLGSEVSEQIHLLQELPESSKFMEKDKY